MDSRLRRYVARTMNSFLNRAFLAGIISPFDPPSEFFSIKQKDLLCKLAIHNRLTLYINFINLKSNKSLNEKRKYLKISNDLFLSDNFNNIIDMHINQS